MHGIGRHVKSGVRIALECGAAFAAYLGGFELLKYFVQGTTALSLAAQLYVVGTAIILVVLLVVREFTAGRKEKYANITSYIHQISLLSKEISVYIQEKRPNNSATYDQYQQFSETCKSKFALVLDQMNLVFASLTSTRCRCSIKLVYEVAGEPYYYTLARDAGCWTHLLDRDNHRVETDHDPLKKNSQFLKIFDSSTDIYHYFSNDIPSDPTFHSTSFIIYDPHWADTGTKPRSMLTRLKGEWPLPYRSTIACAIRFGRSSFLTEVKPVVLGFVTVDSESRNVFEERWDVQLVFAVADSLFHPLRMFLEIQNEKPKPSP